MEDGYKVPSGKEDRKTKVVKKKCYPQNFREQWLTDPRYENWLKRIEGDNFKSTCKYCKCIFSAKLSDLERHRNTKKQQKAEYLHSNGKVGFYPEDEKVGNSNTEESMDIEKLISFVREHRELFDVNQSKSSSKYFSSKLWKEISQELTSDGNSVSANAVEKKWKFLCKKYFVEKKKTMNSEKESDWPLFSTLRFLDDVPETSVSFSTYKAKSKQSSKFDECIEQFICISDDPHQPLKVEQDCDTVKDDDTDFLFMRSLLPVVKKLGPIDNLEFRVEVIQLLKKKLQSNVCYTQNATVAYSAQPTDGVEGHSSTSVDSNAIIIYQPQ